MNRTIFLGLLLILVFVQIITIDGEQDFLTNMDKRRTKEEYLSLILTDDCTYCKRYFRDLFFKRRNFNK